MTTPLATHPGLTRALTAVRSAEIGLLRAVALDLVSIGEGQALDVLGPEAIDVMRGATGPTSLDLQAHSTADGAATTFLGKADHGIAVSAHLSHVVGGPTVPGEPAVPGESPEHLRATLRLVGTHGAVLVDLLRPMLDVRTASGRTQVPFGVPNAGVPPVGRTDAHPADASQADALRADALSAIAESARSGHNISITW